MRIRNATCAFDGYVQRLLLSSNEAERESIYWGPNFGFLFLTVAGSDGGEFASPESLHGPVGS